MARRQCLSDGPRLSAVLVRRSFRLFARLRTCPALLLPPAGIPRWRVPCQVVREQRMARFADHTGGLEYAVNYGLKLLNIRPNSKDFWPDDGDRRLPGVTSGD